MMRRVIYILFSRRTEIFHHCYIAPYAVKNIESARLVSVQFKRTVEFPIGFFQTIYRFEDLFHIPDLYLVAPINLWYTHRSDKLIL